jgi:hypothetical protein
MTDVEVNVVAVPRSIHRSTAGASPPTVQVTVVEAVYPAGEALEVVVTEKMSVAPEEHTPETVANWYSTA